MFSPHTEELKLWNGWNAGCHGNRCSIFPSVGRRRLLKCLLDLHRMLIDADQHYILNDLYITDYCVWIQNVRLWQPRVFNLSIKIYIAPLQYLYSEALITVICI